MKLHHIIEDISRREFYDFYALLYAHQERQHLSKARTPEQTEIEQHLQSIVIHILDDHLQQLGNILIDRLSNPNHQEIRTILNKYGIDYDKETDKLSGIDKLSLASKATIIKSILTFNHRHGFTGDTWLELGETFIKLCHTPQALPAQIMAVDKIYNLLHHGGQLTDYMDEADWLEDALNTRDNANPAQIFTLASPGIRALIGRSSYSGMNREPVNELAKLHTALRRAQGDRIGIDIDNSNNSLTITVDFKPLMVDGRASPWIAWGGITNETHNKLINGRHATLGDWHHGIIQVYDTSDNLIISGGGSEMKISKPINRQYNLAQDLINATTALAKGQPLDHNTGLRKSYFYHNKRPQTPPNTPGKI